ncbi:unnamed protein product, partial [Timema podura]|nr:unnamed protein product [Timema podura]
CGVDTQQHPGAGVLADPGLGVDPEGHCPPYSSSPSCAWHYQRTHMPPGRGSSNTRCVMLPKFEASRVWSQLLAINMPANERVNMFMAVPTIYAKLIDEYEKIFTKNARMQEYVKSVCAKNIRLMVSGSAPLPSPVFDRWADISGHRLLERYGMTETGMVLSNPLKGERR